MHIALLELSFSLPGCRSLKEKRQRVGGLHEKFGRNPALAITEVGNRDLHQQSDWAIVVVGNTKKEVQSLLDQVLEKAERTVDAQLISMSQSFL